MMNHIVLMGRLVREPELRHTRNDKPVASCRIAVERDYDREKADFIDIVAWGKQGEFLAKHFEKGQMIAVAGRLQMRDWTTEDGQKRTSAEVVTENIYFAGAKSRREDTTMPEAQEQAGSFREIPDYEDDGELPF